jgi:mycothiol system anti-sigma-R factor
MNCDEARKLMDGYLDGELDPVTSQKVDQHLRDCRKCEQAYEVDTVLAHAISQAAPYYKAPTELRERIHASLRDAISASTIADTARENQLLARRTKPEHRNIFS